MKPISFVQALRYRLGFASTLYPERCGICGKPTRGNRFIGYWMPCEREHDGVPREPFP